MRIVLRSSTDFNGDRVMFNLPVSHRPQIDMRSGAIFTSPTTVARHETQFWVGKIVARRNGEDEVFFRVYGEREPLDTIEPADWSVRSRGVHSDARLDLLLLSKFGGGTCVWDEVPHRQELACRRADTGAGEETVADEETDELPDRSPPACAAILLKCLSVRRRGGRRGGTRRVLREEGSAAPGQQLLQLPFGQHQRQGRPARG